MLGARQATDTALPRLSREPYVGSLAGELDRASFRLPSEFAEGVVTALGDSLEVTVAAYGEIGSSARVFTHLARVVQRFTTTAIPTAEDEVWRAWDQADARNLG
jgi:hypothetical protein